MFSFFEVGGVIRDELLGVQSKDVDFSCVAQNPEQFSTGMEAFEALIQFLKEQGFKGFSSNKGDFVTKKEFFTITANVPNGHVLKQRTNVADFVLARKDGPSSDGRRPDFVLPGSLHDDLSRRDFTVNAMARCPVTNVLHDPFNGQDDLQTRTLRFVGDPMTRLQEDGLRLLRALRFSVTKGFELHSDTLQLFRRLDEDGMFVFVLNGVSVERQREELAKMFRHDTMQTLQTLQQFPTLMSLVFSELKLMPTLKQF